MYGTKRDVNYSYVSEVIHVLCCLNVSSIYVIIMAADDLAITIARPSAAISMTWSSVTDIYQVSS